jgi:O-acetyl-ADP-ribose deacetylase (regulator of RNase III)
MLRHDGGAARAIAEAGGPTVAKESDQYIKEYGHLPVGGVAVTSAGKLRAFKIIHALGPMYANGASNEDQLYRLTVRN